VSKDAKLVFQRGFDPLNLRMGTRVCQNFAKFAKLQGPPADYETM